MDKGLVTLLGMSISYVASLAGLCLAWWSWRKHHRDAPRKSKRGQ